VTLESERISIMNQPSMASRSEHGAPSHVLALILAWAAVGLPLAWGVAETLRKALALFQ
jgi:hypothetical protein